MENNNNLIVLCLLALHLISIQCIHAADQQDEVAALIAFKNKLIGPNKCLSSWVVDHGIRPDASEFLHVTTSDVDNSVTRLDLEDCELEGPLAPELGTLKNLQYLELHRNKLNGSIPAELGNLTKLVSLDLYENTLDGSIPDQLGNLKNLRFIRLNNNNLSGTVPSAWSNLGIDPNVDLSNNHNLCGWKADKEC